MATSTNQASPEELARHVLNLNAQIQELSSQLQKVLQLAGGTTQQLLPSQQQPPQPQINESTPSPVVVAAPTVTSSSASSRKLHAATSTAASTKAPRATANNNEEDGMFHATIRADFVGDVEEGTAAAITTAGSSNSSNSAAGARSSAAGVTPAAPHPHPQLRPAALASHVPVKRSPVSPTRRATLAAPNSPTQLPEERSRADKNDEDSSTSSTSSDDDDDDERPPKPTGRVISEELGMSCLLPSFLHLFTYLFIFRSCTSSGAFFQLHVKMVVEKKKMLPFSSPPSQL